MCLFGPCQLKSSWGNELVTDLAVSCALSVASRVAVSLKPQGDGNEQIPAPQPCSRARGLHLGCFAGWNVPVALGLFSQSVVLTRPLYSPCQSLPRPLGPISSPLMSCCLLCSSSCSQNAVLGQSVRLLGSKRITRLWNVRRTAQWPRKAGTCACKCLVQDFSELSMGERVD